MEDLSFLHFEQTKERALEQNPFSVAHLDYKGQMQLKPFDPQPYTMTTRSLFDLNIDIEEVKVYLLHCDNQYELTDNMEISNVTDIHNVVQIRLKLMYLPYDFGIDLVQILVKPAGDAVETELGWLYSNPFLLTDYQIEKTTRVDFLNVFTNPLLGLSNPYDGVRLQMYPNNYVSATEIDNYYQISKGQNVISRVNKDRRLQWCFEGADEWHFKRLEEALYNSPCYFNQIRQYPVENIAYEERLADSNISENMIITDPNNNDFLNIIEVIIDDEEKVPMLASSSQVCSSSQLVSEIETVL